MRYVNSLKYLVDVLAKDAREQRNLIPQFRPVHCAKTIWHEKLYCILSSQVRNAVASKAAAHVAAHVPFFTGCLSIDEVEEHTASALRSLRGYRFPTTKAYQISRAWFSFAQTEGRYYEYATSFGCERKARDHIASSFSGFGYKQASMLLRNIGVARNLSVIDSHLLWYMSYCHQMSVTGLTKARYLALEDLLNREADQYGLDLCAYDLVLWASIRTFKRQVWDG